jgi:hypothetical protein
MTTPETPAATIRRAAEAMRKHADAMQAEMAQPSYSWGRPGDGTLDERYRSGVDDALGGASGVLASHWDLATTWAVAAWLVREAAQLDSHVFPQADPAMASYPLAVALGYLGEAGEQVKDITDERKRPVPDWTYTDGDGDKLMIGAGTRSSLLLRVTSGGDDVAVAVGAADIPEFAAELYKAAGLPAPVILDRPVIDPRTGKGVNRFSVLPGADGTVLVSQGGGHDHVPLAPGVARLLAAVIAAFADAADAAEPAEVKELTAVIRKLANGTEIDDLARAILRAGYKRERGTAS